MSVVKFPKAEPFDLESIRLPPEMLVVVTGPEPVEPPKRLKQRVRETEPFVHMDVRDFLAGFDALDSKGELAVWVFILRQWRISPKPVALTNAGLSSWGVSRHTKYRAVEKLLKAGLIEVEAGGKASPRVSPLPVRQRTPTCAATHMPFLFFSIG